MRKEEQNFEQSLKDRILNEELPFDEAAWTGYTSFASKKKKKSRKVLGFIWPLGRSLIGVGLLFASILLIASFLLKDTSIEQESNATKSSPEKFTWKQESHDHDQKKSLNPISTKVKNDNSDENSELQTNSQTQRLSNSSQTQSTQLTVENHKVDLTMMSINEASTKTIEPTQATTKKTKQSNTEKTSQATNSDSRKNSAITKQNITKKSNIATTDTDIDDRSKSDPSSTRSMINNTKASSSSDLIVQNQKSVDTGSSSFTETPIVEIKKPVHLSGITAFVTSKKANEQYPSGPAIIKNHKRLSYFVGVDYLFQNLNAPTDVETNPSFPISLRLGMIKNFGYHNIGLELSASPQQYLPLNKSITSYFSSPAEFKYFEREYYHKEHIDLGLSINYSYALSSKINLNSGLGLKYAALKNVIGTTNTNFSTEEISALFPKAFDVADAVSDFSADFSIGGEYFIWKHLSIQANYRIGLSDLGQDSFWGDSYETNHYSSLGIKLYL